MNRFNHSIVLIIFCGLANIARPQNNLVPNGNFEEHISVCISDTNSFVSFYENYNNLILWYPKKINIDTPVSNIELTYYGTPDYFSTCYSDTLFRSPWNFSGFQYPHSGNAYIGLVRCHDLGKEFTRIQLKEKLKPNTCYSLEFYYCMANKARYAVNKLGMILSVDSFKTCTNDNGFCFTYTANYPSPQLYDININSDTVEWKHIKGEYYAGGGEEWLTLGWFETSSAIDTLLANPDTTFFPCYYYSYYYIDDVSVHLCTDDEEAVLIPNLISPNGDGKNDLYIIDSLPPNSKVSFFNRWGNELYHSDNYQNDWDGTWNGNQLPTGTYYVVVQMPHGTRKSTFVELVY